MSYLKFLDKEERLNTISHAIGALLALFAMIILLKDSASDSVYAIVSLIIYSLTLLSMLLVSAVYHGVNDIKWKRRLRVIDHINIYYLIAGTYSPIALITLIDGNGWIIFGAVWGIALIGSVLKIFFTGRYEILSLLLYLVMGWLIILDFTNLINHTSNNGIKLLILGGAFYTVGILFYAIRKIPYNHFIWHLFVLAGAISHWFFIYLDVV